MENIRKILCCVSISFLANCSHTDRKSLLQKERLSMQYFVGCIEYRMTYEITSDAITQKDKDIMKMTKYTLGKGRNVCYDNSGNIAYQFLGSEQIDRVWYLTSENTEYTLFHRGAFRYEHQATENNKALKIANNNGGISVSSILGFPVKSVSRTFASFPKTYWASDKLLMSPEAYQSRLIYGISDLMSVLEGIPLRVQTDYGSFKVTQEAVNVSEHLPEAALFVLPDRTPEPFLN